MILWVVDANGTPQQIVAQSPTDELQDRSGTGTGASVPLLEAVPDGFVRAGWFFQNNSQVNTMIINELGGEADAAPQCFVVPPGGTWPPPGYPVPQGVVSLAAALNDNYAAREWVTPVPAE